MKAAKIRLQVRDDPQESRWKGSDRAARNE